VPAGADAVVMQEQAELDAGQVRILRPVQSGDNIRRAGEDLRRGDPLLGPGRLLGPLEIALLCSQGIMRLRVRRRPRVAIIVTGDEVVPPEAEPAFGQVRNVNGPCLRAAVESAGALAEDMGSVGDRPEDISALVRQAAARADAILISGGGSVGDRDYTRPVLEGLGVRLAFWKAAIKPGKPLIFGVWSGKLVFGLPGNPVAAWLCCEEFVRPALRLMQGLAPEDRWSRRGRAGNAYPASGGRQQYLFCRAEPAGEGYALQVIRPQGSAMMGMATRSNALALAPAGRPVAPGDELSFRWL
jgi:molybdopterin molybdotransferase